MSSMLHSIFGCCFGCREPLEADGSTTPLIRDRSPPRNSDPVRQAPIIRREEETLSQLVHDTESKMVSIHNPHPFYLRPRTPERSYSRGEPPTRESSEEEYHPDRSMSAGVLPSTRTPILNVKLVKTHRGKARRVNGKGRGRNRVRLRDGQPIEENPEGAALKPAPAVVPLSQSDDELLSALSSNVRTALVNGFQMRDAGRVVQNWDDT